MNQVAVIPEAFSAHGDINATQASMVTVAGTVDQVTAIQAASAVFGPIAADFLAAFAVAQANHAQAVAELANVHAATDVTSHAAAANYELADAGSAAGFDGLVSPDSMPAFGTDDGATPTSAPENDTNPDVAEQPPGQEMSQGAAPGSGGVSPDRVSPRPISVAAAAEHTVAQPFAAAVRSATTGSATI
ncbi:hypothetical protein ACQP2U_23940 [Nocardia sp. CA-084685]|uniref:hypothetical protein n=1 Tax=Nocardia sp. CA-084685 TaxID=3239970 RepID=UPI003D981E01